MANRAGQRVMPEPAVLPDAATEPHRTAHAVQPLPGDTPGVSDCLLQDALPEIAEAARKVGGFKRLSEIAGQLEDGAGAG